MLLTVSMCPHDIENHRNNMSYPVQSRNSFNGLKRYKEKLLTVNLWPRQKIAVLQPLPETTQSLPYRNIKFYRELKDTEQAVYSQTV